MTEPSAEAWHAADKLESDDYRTWDEDFKIALALLLDAFAAQAVQRATAPPQAPLGADAEREAQIRHHVAQVQAMAPYDAENVQGHVTFLLRLLDQARAAYVQAAEAAHRLHDEIARLRAPLGASAMERTTQHLPDCMMPDGAEPCKGFVAMHETVKGQGLSMRAMSDEIRAFPKKIEQAKAEARAKAIEDVIDAICRNPGAHPTMTVVGIIRAALAKPSG